MYTPWWRHVLEFWNKRQEENILFIKYEDLQKVRWSELQIRAGIEDNLKVHSFFLFFNKNICCYPSETVLMIGHKIRFSGEI